MELLRLGTEAVITGVSSRAVSTRRPSFVHLRSKKIPAFSVVADDQSLKVEVSLVVDHPAAQLLSVSPDHLGVVPGTRVGCVRVDRLTVEAWIRDLVVPVLGCVGHPALYGSLVLLLGVPAPVGVLPHIGPVQLRSLGVVAKGALVGPPLSDALQLSAPHQFLHVGGCLLGRVDPARLLPLGHPPPQLVVFRQDGVLGSRAQLSEDCLGGAGAGGSRILAHGVILVLAAVVRIAGCCIGASSWGPCRRGSCRSSSSRSSSHRRLRSCRSSSHRRFGSSLIVAF